MDNLSNTHEFMATTVDEAISRGLEELGLEREKVNIEVLDEGKRNVFKFASRPALIRMTVLGEQKPVEKSTSEVKDIFDELSDDEIAQELRANIAEVSDAEGMVKAVLTDILEKMTVKAVVTTTLVKSEEDDREVVYANIEGDDLSFLIGRKSETLNALQYLTGLIISKKVNHWVPLQVDVQSYRSRRETELKKIARRMADQAISSGRKQFLEPMPANERRIIHMELRGYDQLISESIGEEPNRKVTIAIKK